ncbi:extracellular solute-binding protein [Rhizobium etli]|uniref:extracellular solute-binding protein n=1 Tax=Rhizobium etli TaxID=29449 RepID=UPI0003839923|nr:extracellular solute-binding protein [Rhizobium etli]AGS24524.1 spermidine/putrescine ABC transporter substrate-binding protein [Rhizobium etli bv. mimosae str. Mim1]
MKLKWKLARVLAFAAVFCGALSMSATVSRADEGRLVISSWGGNWGKSIQLGLVDAFEKKTGIRVQLLSTQDSAKSKAAILSGNQPPEDILDTTYATGYTLSRDGLLADIDYSKFDKKTLNALPDYVKQKFGFGYGQFAIGLCYDKEKFPEGKGPKTWADFWNLKDFPGKRSMLAWPEEPTPEMGLLADGVAVTDLYPLDVKAAFKKLDALKSDIPTFPTSPSVLGQMLVDRQVAMEACFTHRVQALIDGGVSRIGIVFDGARLQTQYFTVWKNAPNKENAMKFLAFVAEAAPQAAWAQIGNTGPVNPQAFDLIPKDIAAKLPTSPVYKTWPKDDQWYVGDAGNGKTNQESLEEQWSAWSAGNQ